MCKELVVISVIRVVDKKRIMEKMEVQEEERNKGSLTPISPPPKYISNIYIYIYIIFGGGDGGQ
jgi:hypothetical protein